MSEEDRYLLRPIIEKKALAFAVAMVDHAEIDRINILQASFKAMHLAIDGLGIKPELLLIDGNRFVPYLGIPHQCVIQGDGIYASIAAASVLAKTYRDDFMKKLHEQHPEYGWDRNKGYGTLMHRRQIRSVGFSPYHRMSFNVAPERIEELEQADELLAQNKMVETPAERGLMQEEAAPQILNL